MLSFRKTETVTKAVKQKDMKKWAMAAFGVLFSLIFCFNCLGYAALSANLTIEGTATWSPPEGIYIYEVDEPTGSGSTTITGYVSTVLNSSISLGSKYAEISIPVRVYNNGSATYYFNSVTYDETIAECYTNTNIRYTYEVTATETPITEKDVYPIDQGKTMEITVTFYLYNKTISNPNLDLTSVLNFNFGISSDYVDSIATSGALAKFSELLNTSADYNKMTTEMMKNYNSSKGDWTVSYIGNVAGAANSTSAAADDTQIVEDLFDGQLTLTIDGEEIPITVIIKRENIDGNTATGDSYTINGRTYAGCEMTLYMTTVDLNEMTYPNRASTIYAAVFTKEDGAWYQMSELYSGSAQVVGYVGGESSGSFDTGTWISTEAYYGVRAGSGIGTIVKAYLRQ